ncbi:hypothetical protein ACVDFE_03795 [Lentzea chajnantorensis]
MADKEKITPVKLVASVLAAVTAAVLSLRLNVVGTIIGAVLASVVTTVGAVLYQRSMEREKRWQVVAVGGLLAFVVAVLAVTSVQLVSGTPGGTGPAEQKVEPSTSAEPQKSVNRTENNPPPATETVTVSPPPGTSGRSSAESTTTTAPTTTTTGSPPPADGSTPVPTGDPIR